VLYTTSVIVRMGTLMKALESSEVNLIKGIVGNAIRS